MRHHPTAPRRRRDRERGASLVEYALLLALIAIVAFSAVTYFGSSNSGGFGKSADCIRKAYDNEALCS